MTSAVLYKVYVKKTGDTIDDAFNKTEVMNETELRNFYAEQVKNGCIHLDNLEDHLLSVDDNVNDIELDAIFDIIAENGSYAEGNEQIGNYYIEQFDIRLGDEDLYD